MCSKRSKRKEETPQKRIRENRKGGEKFTRRYARKITSSVGSKSTSTVRADLRKRRMLKKGGNFKGGPFSRSLMALHKRQDALQAKGRLGERGSQRKQLHMRRGEEGEGTLNRETF